MLFWMFSLHVKAEPSWSIILIILMLLMRIVLSFVWIEFSSVGREEWCNKIKNGQKLKHGDAYVTPINIQEVQTSKLGDARASPLHQQKYHVIFQCAIFLLLHILCVILGASLFLFCFVCCNKWLDPIIRVLEKAHSVLIA